MFKNKPTPAETNAEAKTKRPFSYVRSLKTCLIISGTLIVIGIVAALIWGVHLDINFKGGSRYTYSYTGDIELSAAEQVIEDAVGAKVEVSESRDYSGGSAKLVISIADGSINVEDLATDTDSAESATSSAASETSSTASGSEDSTEAGETTETAEQIVQDRILSALQEEFPDNEVTFGDSNTVSATMATKFFLKCICALVIAAVLLLIYIAFRFRNIGGLSAGVMALVALVHDLIIAFIACIVFQLDIDMNFVAVVLTILGYSLNDTIVVYDRIRENRRLYPQKSLSELTDESLLQVTNRTITTSVATFIAVMSILIVAELNGLTTLRTFTIPMALGIISGSYSTLCLSAPLWVKWREYKDSKPKKAKRK